MLIKECKCGSTDFIIEEILRHDAFIIPEDNKKLLYGGKILEHKIKYIKCAKCNKKYSTKNFKGIIFP